VATLALIGMLGYLPLESLWQRHSTLKQQLMQLESENQLSSQQIALYQQYLAKDPNQDHRQRLVLLQQQHQLIDSQLNRQMIDLVPAEAMAELLSQLLGQVRGISLVKFTSVAPTPLLAAQTENKLNLYSHGINMTLEGDYFSIMGFMAAIEALPNKLYWKRLDYQVAQYPKGRVELELYTLSITKDFISVAK
ncbi:MAG: MSHA biogenesis protein MshJ, partial [Shewanella sp.]